MAHHGRKVPKGSELCDYVDTKFGKCGKTRMWIGMRVIYQQETDDLNIVEE